MRSIEKLHARQSTFIRQTAIQYFEVNLLLKQNNNRGLVVRPRRSFSYVKIVTIPQLFQSVDPPPFLFQLTLLCSSNSMCSALSDPRVTYITSSTAHSNCKYSTCMIDTRMCLKSTVQYVARLEGLLGWHWQTILVSIHYMYCAYLYSQSTAHL